LYLHHHRFVKFGLTILVCAEYINIDDEVYIFASENYILCNSILPFHIHFIIFYHGVIMKKKVGIYARTSTVASSTDRQIEELKIIASNHNYEVVEIYNDEGVSGAKRSRPELDRMMSDIFKRKFDTLMTLELSRLGRSVKNMCEILDKCNDSNVNLYVVNQQINTENPMGVFFFNLMNSVYQMERELITERIRSGIANARRKGIKLGRKSTLNYEKELQIIKLKKQGVGIGVIKKKVGVGQKTVYAVLKNHSEYK